MSNTAVILSQEFMLRINLALGEIQAKFAIPVINELQDWVDKAEKAPHELVAAFEAHLAPHKARVEAIAKEVEAAAAKPVAVVEAVEKAV